MRATKKHEQPVGAPSRPRNGAVRPVLVLLALLVVALAGCRSYGSYDAKEKMLPEMRQSVRLFAGDLERARANLDMLRQAASGDSALHTVAEEYAQAVSRHEEILSENQQILSRFEDDVPSYRDVHRVFGAALSEHQAVRNRYRSLIKAVRYPSTTRRAEAPGDRVDSTQARAGDEAFTEGRYYAMPMFYERLQSAGSDVTMRQALAERRQRQAQAGRLGQGQQDEARLPSAASSDTAAASMPQGPAGASN